jgi:hypothetical protein
MMHCARATFGIRTNRSIFMRFKRRWVPLVRCRHLVLAAAAAAAATAAATAAAAAAAAAAFCYASRLTKKYC